HARFGLIDDLIEPIVLRYVPEKAAKPAKARKTGDDIPKHLHTQPAVLVNLSAGGMSLVTFLAPPHAKVFKMTLTVPGLNHLPIEGRVVRVDKKGDTYNVGIQFTKIAKKYQRQIAHMAEDDQDCHTRVALQLPEACVPTCRFHSLCTKPQKAPHWPPKA
ncbi:MAG TPA: PilZ domain-containing protein, partial [Elusimicrobiota bacterium]|nr:PilZ domain-containing protein [Elusimicrobiota bacterium]